MEIDVIIASFAKNNDLKRITQNCINSLHKSSDINTFNILIYEQQRGIVYDGAQTINYGFAFNYNKILNTGIRATHNQYIVLANNDLIFDKYWFEFLECGFKMGFQSLCSYCPIHSKAKGLESGNFILEGYIVGRILNGWCITIDRAILNKIGIIDDSVDFWFSDIIFAQQLQFNNIKHGLVCNSFVTHIESSTIKQMNSSKQWQYTAGNRNRYVRSKRKYR